MNKLTGTRQVSDKGAIRSFPRINFPEAELTQLSAGINADRSRKSLQDVAA